ncbi:MAG TPA: glycosyltransferase family 9 protein [Gemmatimonadaceae bacterium]
MLTTPLIAHLATSGPVDVITTPAAAPLLAGNPSVRRVIPYDKRGADGGVGGLRRLAATVDAASPDAVAFLAQGSLRSAALAMFAGYQHRIGFHTSSGRWLYTRRVTYRPDQHHAERLLRLAVGNDAAIASGDLKPALYPADADRQAVATLLTGQGANGERLIALAPGSVWATKRWPGYPALAASLAKHGRVVVIGGSGDAEHGAAIRSAVPGAIDATGQLGLLASAELIRRSVLLVTNDSLPQHLASAMGTPTVTIFGPTIPGFGFGPLAPRSSAVGHEFLQCRPCHPHGPPACPLGHHRCMRDLPAADVLARALDALAG